MQAKKRLGDAGESIVAEYLRGIGHTILATQYRSGHLEVDVISYDDEGVHFVEVKTRREPVMKDPVEAVNHAKRTNIIRAAKSYMTCELPRELGLMESFFDVAVVLYHEDGSVDVQYYPKAYTQVVGFSSARAKV